MHRTVIEHEYSFGECLYVASDPDQFKRQVIDIVLHGTGVIMYVLQCGTEHSNHYEFELSREKDLTL